MQKSLSNISKTSSSELSKSRQIIRPKASFGRNLVCNQITSTERVLPNKLNQLNLLNEDGLISQADFTIQPSAFRGMSLFGKLSRGPSQNRQPSVNLRQQKQESVGPMQNVFRNTSTISLMKRGSLVKMLSKHDDDLFNQLTFDQDPFAHFGVKQTSKMFENNSPSLNQFSRVVSMNGFAPLVPSQEKPGLAKQDSIPTSNISLFKPVVQVPTEIK